MLFHVILNAYWEPLEFELPRPGEAGETPWRRWIDTALNSPHDILRWEAAAPVPGSAYRAEARSVVMLLARREMKKGQRCGHAPRNELPDRGVISDRDTMPMKR
jgi:glycogen operon protein